MKFLYKINSGYDGFSPRRISQRLIDKNHLWLGWTRYRDVVDVGSEVWVFFCGPHRFEDGVYLKGFVSKIDDANSQVLLRVREFDEGHPVTDAITSQRVAQVVATRYRQVFLFPDRWQAVANCSINSSSPSTCAQRLCESCKHWQSLPQIDNSLLGWPERLSAPVEARVSAYWVIPNRCRVPSTRIPQTIHQTSDLFMRFKLGTEALAYPLALGIYTILSQRGLVDFDCIVPVPLSPDKAAQREIHRTALLAGELKRLLGAPVLPALALNTAISKRRMLSQKRYSVARFEQAYYDSLLVDQKATQYSRILLVDDVSTHGSTLDCAVRRLRSVNPHCRIVVATAGQMIVKAVLPADGMLHREQRHFDFQWPLALQTWPRSDHRRAVIWTGDAGSCLRELAVNLGNKVLAAGRRA